MGVIKEMLIEILPVSFESVGRLKPAVDRLSLYMTPLDYATNFDILRWEMWEKML